MGEFTHTHTHAHRPEKSHKMADNTACRKLPIFDRKQNSCISLNWRKWLLNCICKPQMFQNCKFVKSGFFACWKTLVNVLNWKLTHLVNKRIKRECSSLCHMLSSMCCKLYSEWKKLVEKSTVYPNWSGHSPTCALLHTHTILFCRHKVDNRKKITDT